MPKFRNLSGIQNSRWGFNPKDTLGDEPNENDSSNHDNGENNTHIETETGTGTSSTHPNTSDAYLPPQTDSKNDQVSTESVQVVDHKTDTSTTITEQEWSVIQKASAEFEREQENHSVTSGSNAQNMPVISKKKSRGGDQLGAEALLDLGKPSGYQDDEASDSKKHHDGSQNYVDLNSDHPQETLDGNEEDDVVTAVAASKHSEVQDASNTDSFEEQGNPHVSGQDSTSSTADSEKSNPSATNASHPSATTIVAAAATAINPGNPPATSSLTQSLVSINSSVNSNHTLDPEIQAFLNQDNPNWQRFYAENIASNDVPTPVDLSMIINGNDSGDHTSGSNISKSVSAHNIKSKSKRGRKRKVSSINSHESINNATATANNQVQESEVDPSLEQLDINAAAAAASEIDAVCFSKEQSQLEDALLHASAIARDLHSQSPNQHVLYDESMISEVGRAVKKRNTNSLANAHINENDNHSEDESGINNLILTEALRMASRSKYQSQHHNSASPDANDNQGVPNASVQLPNTEDYWADSVSVASSRQHIINSLRMPKPVASARKPRKRNVSSSDSMSAVEDVQSAATRRRYSKRNSSMQQDMSGQIEVPQIKELNDAVDGTDTSIMDPNDWQPTQELIERGGSFTDEEIRKLDSFMTNYCLDHHIDRDTLCRRVWSSERVKDNFWDRVADVLPHRARASVYKHIRRTYHVFKARGKWQDHEEEELKKLYNEKGPQWKIIGQRMRRMPEDCRDRWRNYVKCGENRLRNKWDLEEEEKLREAVAYVISEHPDNEINWTAVSDRMNGTRSRIQCRYKWNKMMKRATIAKIDAMMTQDKLSLIKYLLENGYEDESQVDWDGFAAMDSRGFWSGSELQMAFERLKPKDTYLNRSFHDIVVTLHHELSMDAGNLKSDELEEAITDMGQANNLAVTNVAETSGGIPSDDVIDPAVSGASSLPGSTVRLSNELGTSQTSSNSHVVMANEEEVDDDGGVGSQTRGISVVTLNGISGPPPSNTSATLDGHQQGIGINENQDMLDVSPGMSEDQTGHNTNGRDKLTDTKSRKVANNHNGLGSSKHLNASGSISNKLVQKGKSSLFRADQNIRLITYLDHKDEHHHGGKNSQHKNQSPRRHEPHTRGSKSSFNDIDNGEDTANDDNNQLSKNQRSERVSQKDTDEDLMAVAAAAMQHSI